MASQEEIDLQAAWEELRRQEREFETMKERDKQEARKAEIERKKAEEEAKILSEQAREVPQLRSNQALLSTDSSDHHLEFILIYIFLDGRDPP